MARQPKEGDQRIIGTCALCGGTEYEVYLSKPDGEKYWRLDRHEYKPDRTLCISELVRRIEALEPKKRGKK